MYTSIKINWKKHFGWTEDYLLEKNIKAKKSKRSWAELSELINDAAKPIINEFTDYGERNKTPLYGRSYGNDVAMSIFLYTLSSWEEESHFLIEFADALYEATFMRGHKEYKMDIFVAEDISYLDPLQVDTIALVSRLPHNISKTAKELLYLDFKPRVQYLVSKVKEKFLYDDLVSVCWELLFCDVIYKYKPEKGHFSTYATTSMLHRITKYINAQGMVKIDDRSMKRRRERGETTFTCRDFGLSINSETGYTFESYFADRSTNVENEALERIEIERAEKILAECRAILGFPDNCDISIGRYLKYKGFAYPGVEPMKTREIAEKEFVSMRAIQISLKTAVPKIAELGKKYPVLLYLIDMDEYKVIITKQNTQKKKGNEKNNAKSTAPEGEGWLPLL